MKIGNPADKPLAVVPTTSHGAGVDAAKPGPATAAVAAPAGTPDPSAMVELSSTAAALLSGSTPFDAEKVARISQAIAEGSFKINPEVIADKLIGNARELLSKVER